MPLRSSHLLPARMEYIDSQRTNVHKIYLLDLYTQMFQDISISVIVGQK